MAKATKAQRAIINAFSLAKNASSNTFQLRVETGYKAISVHIHRLKKLGVVIETEYAPTTHDGFRHKGVATYTLISIPSGLYGGTSC